jgi:hypothetical protein
MVAVLHICTFRNRYDAKDFIQLLSIHWEIVTEQELKELYESPHLVADVQRRRRVVWLAHVIRNGQTKVAKTVTLIKLEGRRK